MNNNFHVIMKTKFSYDMAAGLTYGDQTMVTLLACYVYGHTLLGTVVVVLLKVTINCETLAFL